MTICKTKKWGSSLGIVIPKAVVDEMHLTENQDVEVELQPKTNVLKEMWGFAKKNVLLRYICAMGNSVCK